jgi:hypothetical protein
MSRTDPRLKATLVEIMAKWPVIRPAVSAKDKYALTAVNPGVVNYFEE